MNVTRIREIRIQKGIKLSELSKKTGYTPSYLSQLERGIKIPSLDALRRIGDSLGIAMLDLISDDADEVQSEVPQTAEKRSCEVIRKNERKKAVMPQILTEYEFVTPYARGEQAGSGVIGLLTSVAPGCKTCEKLVAHPYEESIFIVHGKARAYVADEVHELSEGDSIYIYADVPNNFENCGEEELILLGYTSRPLQR